MSENVKVPYGKGGDNAVLLLEAAQKMDLDPSVVRTTQDGFEVPKEVAEEAGVDTYDPNEEFEKEVAKARKAVEKGESQEARGSDMTLSRSGFDEQARNTEQPSRSEKAPAKKAAAKKAPAKKATAKKAAAKKSTGKES